MAVEMIVDAKALKKRQVPVAEGIEVQRKKGDTLKPSARMVLWK